jgi:hypothetical protein
MADIYASETGTWGEDSGFSPIGNETTQFTGTYNGQGYTIDSLTINRTDEDYIGLFGYTSGASINSLGMTNVDIQGSDYVGGLVGYNNSSIVSSSYSTGSVSGSEYVGGLAGYNHSATVSYCYSTGSVSGSEFVGGLVGVNRYSASVSYCYSVGSVSGSASVGALVGYNYSASTVSSCYYNSETSGQASGIGSDFNSQTVTALTTNQMKLQDSFDAWDFTDTGAWEITEGTTFPRLQDVYDFPIILSSLDLAVQLGDIYNDTIQVVSMDNQSVSLQVLSYPEGMSIAQDSILTWTPDSIGEYVVKVEATDSNGYNNTVSFNIYVADFSGNGIESDPFHITSLTDLYALSQNSDYWGYSFIQTADIDASETCTWNDGSGFSPIGNSSTKFTGTYNGQGYAIDSLTINKSNQIYVGLFGFTNGATISNVEINNGKLTGNYCVGGLVGYNYSSAITKCYVTGIVTGSDNYIGGLVGYNYSSAISNSFFTGIVSGVYNIGGLVGRNNLSSTISNCYSTGIVTGNGNYAGGLVGSSYSSSTISNCYTTVSVSGDSYIGDLLGYNSSNSSVENCYYNSETSTQGLGIGIDSNSQTVTSLTSNEMKQSSYFNSWDFTDTGDWEITEGTTFPRLKDVADVPIILNILDSTATVNETYTDTIRLIYMDNSSVSLELLTYPDGMTITQDSVLQWTPTATGEYKCEIKATDANGLLNTFSYTIDVYGFSGEGTMDNPFQIAKLDNLAELSETSDIWDKYFIQTADIDASETSTWDDGGGFSPIGNGTTQFTGTFNGQGYIIDSLTVNRSGETYVGLFGYAYDATISNVEINNGILIGSSYVGGLVGNNCSSDITKCYVTGNVTSNNSNTGGLLGYNSSSDISNSYFTGIVSGGSSYVGGLVGFSYSSTIFNCYSTGSVTGNSNYVGGLIGYNRSSSTISNCYTSGKVEGKGTNIGDLIGYNRYDSTVDSCYYNSETCTLGLGIGYDGNSQTVNGLTTYEMKQSDSFNNWDFSGTWEITDGTTFPRLIDLDDAPIICHIFTLTAEVGTVYKDTVQIVAMDNQDVTLGLVSYPDGMTVTEDSIIVWTPTEWGEYTIDIIATDANGLASAASYEIQTVSFSGNGTESDPYQIASLDDLLQLSELTSVWDKYYIQTADIDASETSSWNDEEGFSPIGNDDLAFTGNYNGQGYAINNLTVNRSSERGVGLFGHTNAATIESLTLSSCAISGNMDVGSLVGNSVNSSISSCYATGTVSGSESTGGLIGVNSASIIYICYASCTVSGIDRTGGLIGSNYESTLNYCYATSAVEGINIVGGLIGDTYASNANNCYATGFINGNDVVGGLQGNNMLSSTTSNCYFNSQSSGQTNAIGHDDSDSQRVTALTTAQMKQSSNFIDWDFTDTLEIDNGITFPRFKNLDDVPVILQNLVSVLKVGASYCDTIQAVAMDNQTITLSLLQCPDEMTFTQDSIISWVPTEWGEFAVVIEATDANGLINTYHHTIQVIGLSGEGTQEDPYQIATLDNLEELSETSDFWDKYFVQTADIDASETKNWNITEVEMMDPMSGTISYTDTLGFSTIGERNILFTGTYNGQGYNINNLTISNLTEDYVGLFGYTFGANINNLGLKNCNISGREYVGGLVAYGDSSSIKDCYVAGDISGTYFVGGLAGALEDTASVSSCYTTGKVSGNEYVGGVVGDNAYSSIINCYSLVAVDGLEVVGGLVGDAESSTIKCCYVAGNVKGDIQTGALVGYNDANSVVDSCYYNWETSLGFDGIGTDDNDEEIFGLRTFEMKQQASFTYLDFENTWSIIEDNTYPVLLGISNNAPFAFADTLYVAGSVDLKAGILANDYDYETGQDSLTYKIMKLPQHGSVNDGIFTFNSDVITREQDLLIYFVGEFNAQGDTLWGNSAQVMFEKVDNTAPVLTAVNDTTIEENTSLVLLLDDVTVTDAEDDVLSLLITEGDNYSVSGDTIIPNTDYVGTLSVGISVSDGELTSEVLYMTVTVKESNANGVSDLSAESILVYPNPVTTTLYVTGSTGVAYLYNMAGNTVLNQNLSQSTSMNISDLPDGVYLLKIEDEVIKVVKK